MNPHRLTSRRSAAAVLGTGLVVSTVLAVSAGTLTAGGAAPIRLLGVSAEQNALLIEASEPVAYAVSRPDPLTVVVELRNVSVGDASNEVRRAGPFAAVALEQDAAVDGAAVARVRVALARPAEYKVRSARNVIRVEVADGATASAAPAAAAVPLPAAAGDVPAATVLERIRARQTPAATTVTLSGNGFLAPARIAESEDGPRRLLLDFPEVSPTSSHAVAIDSVLVNRVRAEVRTTDPLVTRVSMELPGNAAYHLERTGPAGRDLNVVFEAPAAGAPALIPEPDQGPADSEPEPAITLAQAMQNVAAITQPEPAEPITALKQAAAAPKAPAQTPVPAPAAAPRQTPAQSTLAVQPPAPLGVQATPDTTRTFTGHPISLDFQGADLRAVLRGFSEISGLNMVIDPDVQGTVDIILTEVPWDQALEVILRGNQLDYTVDGTIVRIARLDTLKREQDQRQALAKSAADAGTLAVRTFSLSYARASAAAPLIKRAALSPRGDVQIDDRTNTLIITDLPGRLDTAASLLSTLDRAEPQVEVEARIVQTTRDFARAVGIEWGLNGRVMPDVGNTTNLAFPNRGTLGGRLGAQGPIDPRSTALEQTGTAVNLGVSDASSAIGLALGAVNGAFNLDVALSALERTGKGRVLSTPRLTTQNNIEAEVAQGIQIPIQTVANNTVTVSFKDAVLVLKVTPQITAANTVIMKIIIENATPDFSRQVNGIPPIDTQRANTQVQINDGMTTVIGGIFVSREQSSVDKTPLLDRVPLLGWLFKRERVEDASRELLIFITPRILKG